MVAIPLRPPDTILNGNINKLTDIANKKEPKAIITYFFKISKKSPFLLFDENKKICIFRKFRKMHI